MDVGGDIDESLNENTSSFRTEIEREMVSLRSLRTQGDTPDVQFLCG